ncbi:hypothetical protein [Glycomyces salinus]|uniref:hypothetical protein n=1 Tax=Glycomyces salinus TaxID=980294 RepID=UPI0018EBDC8C|nr:hypothetical protein [Glycomyces salinus]
MILFERYAPEQAATVKDTTGSPTIAWLDGYADRPEAWKRDLSAEIRTRLTNWAQS